MLLNDFKNKLPNIIDGPGHDHRYAINCDKIENELDWKQAVTFEEGLDRTVSGYLAHPEWIDHVKSGEYRKWLEKNYETR